MVNGSIAFLTHGRFLLQKQVRGSLLGDSSCAVDIVGDVSHLAFGRLLVLLLFVRVVGSQRLLDVFEFYFLFRLKERFLLHVQALEVGPDVLNQHVHKHLHDLFE